MNDKEKSNTIKECREAGNELYRSGKIDEAEEKYHIALGIVEQLLLKYVSWIKIGYISVNKIYYLQRKAPWWRMVGANKHQNSVTT